MTGLSNRALSGRTVFLVGGVAPESDYSPERGEREILADDEWEIRTEEAVNALARAVFLRGGQLAFRHHALLTSSIKQQFASPRRQRAYLDGAPAKLDRALAKRRYP